TEVTEQLHRAYAFQMPCPFGMQRDQILAREIKGNPDADGPEIDAPFGRQVAMRLQLSDACAIQLALKLHQHWFELRSLDDQTHFADGRRTEASFTEVGGHRRCSWEARISVARAYSVPEPSVYSG